MQHDDIIIFEVMTDMLDREWWTYIGASLSTASRKTRLQSAPARSNAFNN